MNIGYNKPLYIQPFDHRGSFQTKLFGWKGKLTEAQTAEIAASKQVIYDGFKAAIAGGVPKEKAGILVDEQFGQAILRDATANGYTTACPAEKSGQDEFDFEYGEEFAKHIEDFDPSNRYWHAVYTLMYVSNRIAVHSVGRPGRFSIQ